MQIRKTPTILRWSAVSLLFVVGLIDIYYGNFYAGFFENLWYVMGSIYIFTGAVIAANFEPRFTQPAVFGYAIFLFALWATTALGTGAGLDTVAYVDKAIEALLVVNMALLIRSSRNPSALS
ncbi:hypothetical protein E6H30_04790 [Candidatus Bathyarchaeota archaeon]|nr:MAG: hypothetical protein E6H30_04790 [Candidatus Bathyarchaeota archaeon]